MEYYDAIVIGAGPAGCSAARELTDSSFKTLLLERERVPREKPCGGVLSAEALGRVEERFGPLPAEVARASFPVAGVKVVGPSGDCVEIPYSPPRLALPRPAFDAWLARESGAVLLDGAEVFDFDAVRFENVVRARRDGEELAFASTYMVGADGGASLTLRMLRPEFSRLYQEPNLVRLVELVFPPDGAEGEHWRGVLLTGRPRRALRVLAAPDGLRLFLPLRGGERWEDLLPAVLPLLRRHFRLEAEEPAGRRIGVFNRMGQDSRFNPGAGSVLLAGEAGGLVDPWGDGIAAALESGETAAVTIVDGAGEKILPHVLYSTRLQPALDRFGAARAGKYTDSDLVLRGSPYDPANLVGRRRYHRLLGRLAG